MAGELSTAITRPTLGACLEVRAADGGEEQGVAREKRLAVQEVARALPGVPRSPERLQAGGADADLVAVVHG